MLEKHMIPIAIKILKNFSEEDCPYLLTREEITILQKYREDEFRKSIAEGAKIVDTWPEWKRNCLK